MASLTNNFTVGTTYKTLIPDIYDICEINGSKFAIFKHHMISDSDINIDLADFNVVFLGRLEAEQNISIKAISVIFWENILCKNGNLSVQATKNCIVLSPKVDVKGDGKFVADKLFCCSSTKERLETTLGLFEEAVCEKDGLAIVSALNETHDILVDPFCELTTKVNLATTFEFFGISFDSQKTEL